MSEKQSFYLDRIEHTALRMQTVIEDILAYSGTGKKEQHVQSIDLNQVLEDIKLDLELVIHEKKAVLMSLDLPTIEGSAVLIGQLLYNLVHNGLKFTRAGVAPKIVIVSYIISSGGKKLYESMFRIMELVLSRPSANGSSRPLNVFIPRTSMKAAVWDSRSAGRLPPGMEGASRHPQRTAGDRSLQLYCP